MGAILQTAEWLGDKLIASTARISGAFAVAQFYSSRHPVLYPSAVRLGNQLEPDIVIQVIEILKN